MECVVARVYVSVFVCICVGSLCVSLSECVWVRAYFCLCAHVCVRFFKTDVYACLSEGLAELRELLPSCV